MKIKTLRKLAVKLTPTGTIEQISNPIKLYVNCYGFVMMQCYVPKTPNTTEYPLCKVYKTSIDTAGNRVKSDNTYDMVYAADVELDGFIYMVFECPMPREFADTEGELTIVYNYCDSDGEGKAIDLLATGAITFPVAAGGWNDSGVALEETDVIAAQVNKNTIDIAELQEDTAEALEKANKAVIDIEPKENNQGFHVEFADGREKDVDIYASLPPDQQEILDEARANSETALSTANAAKSESAAADAKSATALSNSETALERANDALDHVVTGNGTAFYEVDEEGNRTPLTTQDIKAPVQEQFDDLDTRLEDMAAQSEPITGEIMTVDETTAEGVISDITVKGRSTQNVLVAGSGKNKFNINSAITTNNVTASVDGNSITLTSAETTNPRYATMGVSLAAGTYTAKAYFGIVSGVGDASAGTLLFMSGGTVLGSISSNGGTLTFTLSSSATITITFNVMQNGSDGGAVSISWNSIQIESGSTATAYEPYTPASPSPEAPSPIIDTETLTFRASNKNRINIMDGAIRTTPAAGLTYTRSDGLLTINGTKSGNTEASVITGISALLAPGTYNISVTCFSGTRPNGYIVLYLYDGAGNRIVSLDSNGSANLSFNRNFTLASDVVIKEIRWGTVNSNVIYDNYTIGIQVKHGSGMDGFTVAQSYAYPYGLSDGTNNYALRSLPDGTADSISADGVLQQRVVKFSADSGTVVTDNGVIQGFRSFLIRLAIPPTIASNGVGVVISSHFKSAPASGVQEGTIYIFKGSVNFSIAVFANYFTDYTAAQFKQWMIDNAVVFEYAYADDYIPAPIQLSSPLPQIPTYDGQTSIWTDEGVTLDSKLWRHGFMREPMILNLDGTYPALSKYTFFEDGSTLDDLKALLIPDLLYDKDIQPDFGAGSYPNGLMGGIYFPFKPLTKYNQLRVVCVFDGGAERVFFTDNVGHNDSVLSKGGVVAYDGASCSLAGMPALSPNFSFNFSGGDGTNKNNTASYYVRKIEGLKI